MAETRLPSAFAELRAVRREMVSGNRTRTVGRPGWPPRCRRSASSTTRSRLGFEEAIDYCDKFPLDDVPDDALNLLHLVYSMIMVSMAVEVFGTQKPADSADAVMHRVSAPVP